MRYSVPRKFRFTNPFRKTGGATSETLPTVQTSSFGTRETAHKSNIDPCILREQSARSEPSEYTMLKCLTVQFDP